MTNREALVQLRMEFKMGIKVIDFSPTLSSRTAFEILTIMDRAKDNPNFLDEEFKAEYPIQDEE